MFREAAQIRVLTTLFLGVLISGLVSGCGAAGPDPAPRTDVVATRTTTSPASTPALTPASTPESTPESTPGTTAQAITTADGQGGSADSVEVDKCWTNATATSGGQLLISARSSDHDAHLRAYRPDGTLIGEVHNGGGQRYGGTVFAWEPTDPGSVTIRSSAGGSSTVRTTPFRPES